MTTAADFHALHAGPGVLVLPNAWDAASAAMMQDAGAKAVATSSAAVAWSRGYADGDNLPVPVLLDVVSGMARVLSVPLSADIEGGFTDDPEALTQTVSAVIGAGAVGINLEDGTRDADLHARKIEAAREAGVRSGVSLFINARIDVYLKGLAEGEAAVVETLRRAKLYAEAGASGIFVPGPIDETLIGQLAGGISLPLNIMGRSGAPTAARLSELGVRRLSSAYGVLNRTIAAFLESGDSNVFTEASQGMPDLNKRFG